MAKKEFWFAAEGEKGDGSVRRFHVYTSGKKAIYVHALGPNLYEHLCPPSVRMDEKAVIREIELVFDVVKVTKVEDRRLS